MGVHLLPGLLTYGAVSLLPTTALVGIGGLLVEGIAPASPAKWGMGIYATMAISGIFYPLPARRPRRRSGALARPDLLKHPPRG